MRSKILIKALKFYGSGPFLVSLISLTTAWGGPLEEGEKYERQHLYYQAAQEYRKIDNPELRELKLNHLNTGWNGLDGQIMKAQENVAKNPNSAEAHYQLADKYYQKGEALIAYQRTNLKNYPETTLETEKTFFFNAATMESNQALQLNPNYPQAHLLLGKIYLVQGKKPEAIQEINQALALDPNFRDGYISLAQTYLTDKSYDQAEASLLKLVELNPNDAATHTLLGNLYLERKDPGKAISEFNRVIQLNPSDGEVTTLLAKAYHLYGKDLYREGKYDQAVEAFQKAFQLRSLKEYYDDLQTALKRQEEVRLASFSKPEKAKEEISKPAYKKKKKSLRRSKVKAVAGKSQRKAPSVQPPAPAPQAPASGVQTPTQPSSQPSAPAPQAPTSGAPTPPAQSPVQPPAGKPASPGQPAEQSPPSTGQAPPSGPPGQPPQPAPGEQR
ncbi:MAG TPA: tetratricopeptide repeat protein [Candidatus Limnocylindrales bacterium]|nr:tetratricopeptide repeat protein [Candidatus Limnocylindrales bacterium]